MSETLVDVIIVGAGPAGLTCADELIRINKNLKIAIFEADSQVGGISKTVNHNGNRIDIGGHRFFSKSDWVMDWWKARFPVESSDKESVSITYQNKTRAIDLVSGGASGNSDNVLLVRERLSRIFYREKFFDYPLKFNPQTFIKLGFLYSVISGISLVLAKLNQKKPEISLEDFLINRFGRKLYLTFFKEYTEKVWGVDCDVISAEWGAQRIKGVSLRALLSNYVSSLLGTRGKAKKDAKTSLIENFFYPKFGPGQLWEVVTEELVNRAVTIELQHLVCGIERQVDDGFIVTVRNLEDSTTTRYRCKSVVSTMPITNLLDSLSPSAPTDVLAVSKALPYRDFMTVGVLVDKLSSELARRSPVDEKNMPADNWIYIQEPGVKVGRIQIFNNWSPYMVKDPNTVWMGLEYFCDEKEAFWSWDDRRLMDFAVAELKSMKFISEQSRVLDTCVIRVPKAYPAYFGAYADFGVVKNFLSAIPGLYVIGRNGMHRYNNQDHSMLTAKFAAESITGDADLRDLIWSVNIDDEYHEEK